MFVDLGACMPVGFLFPERLELSALPRVSHGCNYVTLSLSSTHWVPGATSYTRRQHRRTESGGAENHRNRLPQGSFRRTRRKSHRPAVTWMQAAAGAEFWRKEENTPHAGWETNDK